MLNTYLLDRPFGTSVQGCRVVAARDGHHCWAARAPRGREAGLVRWEAGRVLSELAALEMAEAGVKLRMREGEKANQDAVGRRHGMTREGA